jgi:predicted PurR-regulated permease PerM
MVLVCDTIGFTIVGLEAPLLFGVFCGLTDLIPYIGPYIGGAAAVVVGFSQGPVIGISVLIICIIVQLVENYILQPVVMSKAMQLHPVTIIVGLLIFGHFFGIIGMIIATPCIALLKVIYRFIVNKYDLFQEKSNITAK